MKRRYLLVEENPDVLIDFYAMCSANDVVTIKFSACRGGLGWFDTESISKDVFAEYVKFLKEQL